MPQILLPDVFFQALAQMYRFLIKTVYLITFDVGNLPPLLPFSFGRPFYRGLETREGLFQKFALHQGFAFASSNIHAPFD